MNTTGCMTMNQTLARNNRREAAMPKTGPEVKRLRQMGRLSQEDAGKALGMSRVEYRVYEREDSIISEEVYERMKRAFAEVIRERANRLEGSG